MLDSGQERTELKKTGRMQYNVQLETKIRERLKTCVSASPGS